MWHITESLSSARPYVVTSWDWAEPNQLLKNNESLYVAPVTSYCYCYCFVYLPIQNNILPSINKLIRKHGQSKNGNSLVVGTPPPSLAKRQTISGFFLMKASLIDRLKHGNGKTNHKNMGRISVGPLLWVKSLPPPSPPTPVSCYLVSWVWHGGTTFGKHNPN